MKNIQNLIDFITQNNLLTPFYQEVFIGVYNVGLQMSSWQTSWTAHIINGINKELVANLKVMKKNHEISWRWKAFWFRTWWELLLIDVIQL